MSQEVSSNPRPRSGQGDRPPIKPWSAESDADNLMDELFSDIDRILDGGSKLPTEPVKPEYISLQPIVMPPITTPPSVESPQEPTEEEVIPEATPIAQEPVEPIQTSIVHKPSPPLPKRSGWSFEKFLVAAGLASVIATIVLLLANQKKITWPWTPQNPPPSSFKMGQLSGSDAEFVNYMRRSLDVLDNKNKAKQSTKTASASGTTNPPSQPSGQASGNRPQVPNQQASVPGGANFPGGAVFFPVYPPQGASASSGLPQALRPPMSAFPQTVPAPAPAFPQGAKSAAPAQQSIPIKPQVAALPQSGKPAASASAPVQSIPIKPQVPALPQSAKPDASAAAQPAKPSAPPIPQTVAAAPAPSATSAPSQIPQSSASAVQHTLMGVMELGDRSAALFEVNGVTKRFNVGESIGASGWTLVSVTNSEAMIRRNGEVRSIYPGQKF